MNYIFIYNLHINLLMYVYKLLIKKVILALEKLRAGKGAKKWQGGGAKG